MVERRAAEALGIRADALWQALVRPEPVSSTRLRSICCVAVTLKLDGRRAALIFADQSDDCVVELTSDGFRCIESGEEGEGPVTILDCELYGEVYHVFDVIVFIGNDVRHLPLYERTKLVDIVVSSNLALQNKALRVLTKPYVFLSPDHPTPGHLIDAALKQRGLHTDGLILVNAIDPYWVPPLKFKEKITSDFLLQRAKHGGGFVFLSKKASASQRNRRGSGGSVFCPLRDKSGAVVHLLTPPPKAVTVALASNPNGVVVECSRTATGSARIKKLRPDRLAPNRTSVVEENADLHDAGCHRRSWLLKSISGPVDAVACFWKYCEALWRFAVKNATQKCGGRLLIVFGSLERNLPDGFVERGLTPSQLARAELLDLRSSTPVEVEKLIRNENRRSERPSAVLFPLSLGQLFVSPECTKAAVELLREATTIAGVFSPGRYGTPKDLASAINGRIEISKSSPTPCAAYAVMGAAVQSFVVVQCEKQDQKLITFDNESTK
jgi:hypothetical protein